MWTFTFGTTTGVSQSFLASILAVTQDAADYWGRYIDFRFGVIDIRINVVPLDDTTLAQAGGDFYYERTVNGADVFQIGSIIELTTGSDPNGLQPDIEIDIDQQTLIQGGFYLGGAAAPNVTPGDYDLFTVLIHEFGHGLGFLSFGDPPPADQAVYDLFVSRSSGAPTFIGPLAVALFGGAVPLAVDGPSHTRGFSDIMNSSIGTGVRNFASALDVAILGDIGLPRLLPTNGDDSLYGFERNSSAGQLVGGDDVIALLDGDDWFAALSGADSVDGGAGRDTVFGGDGGDTLSGGDGNDTLDGGAQTDQLSGGAGNDVFANADSDTIDGGPGFDIVSYASAGAGIFIRGGGGFAGAAAGAQYLNVEAFIGTAFADTLEAHETLGGGVRFEGRAGDDSLVGGPGRDALLGGAGADTIAGGSNADTLNGGLGLDTLDGGTAFDTIDYGDRTGAVNVNVINGAAFTGGALNIDGFYAGGALEDTLLNLENIIGTAFGDRLIAGSTSARIEGRGGDDYLFSFSGNDTVLGGDGNDFIATGKSTDQLFGEAGDDTLDGGTGLDTLDGGAGADTADYSGRTGGVSVNLFSGSARTGGALNGAGIYAGSFVEDALVSIENIIGSAFGDRLVGSEAGSNISGGGGGDSIASFSGADTLDGGAGDDTLAGGDGDDRFIYGIAGGGADRVVDFVSGTSAVIDAIEIVGGGAAFDSFAKVIAAASQSGPDVVFDFGGGSMLTLANVLVADLETDDFAFG